MGGATIFEHGPELENLFDKVKKQIIESTSVGLYPDSDLIVVCEEKKMYDIYRVKMIPNEGNPRDIIFERVETGDAERSVAFGKYFAEKQQVPKSDYIVAVHLHT